MSSQYGPTPKNMPKKGAQNPNFPKNVRYVRNWLELRLQPKFHDIGTKNEFRRSENPKLPDFYKKWCG